VAVRTTLGVSQCIHLSKRERCTAITLLPLANQLAVRPIRYVAVLEAAKLWELLDAGGVERRATYEIYHNFV
jgi:hypothetical protein